MSSHSNKGVSGGLIYTLVFLIVATIVAFLVIAMVGPNDEFPSNTTADNEINNLPVPAGEAGSGLDLPVTNLIGQWSAENNGVQFVATIGNDTVTIMFVNDGMSMTYWHGDFRDAESVGQTVVSNKLDINKAVMSQASSKNFAVGENSLSFEFEAMGMTKRVEMSRVSA
jgi:hypothetical protein